MKTNVPIEKLTVAAYEVPTDYPEADGTIAWSSTIMVYVEIQAGGKKGMGFSYADKATAVFIESVLRSHVEGQDAMSINKIFVDLAVAVRNHGRPGVASMAISAVDVALWDLKARLLDVPLVTLLGAVREAIPVYGSGGFTSYPIEKLKEQLAAWAGTGIPRVKMKIGTHPLQDPDRVRAAREAIGPDTELFVDANGAYSHKQALVMADVFADQGVVWFGSLFPPTILPVFILSEKMRLLEWRSPQANTATIPGILEGCSRRRQWTYLWPTGPGAEE